MNIFDNNFDSYGKALNKVLESRGLSKTWLARKIHVEGQKPSFNSIRSMISRWVSGDPVSLVYQKKINALFDFSIKQGNNGRWVLSRTNNNSLDKNLNAKPNTTLDQLLQEERSRLGIQDIPDTERGRELQGMLDDAVSLVLKIRRSIEREKGK